MNESRSIGSFQVSIYHRSSIEALAEYVGMGPEWRLQPVLRAPVGDLSYSVRVDTVWVDLLNSFQDRIEQEVEGLSTIIKFGDTLQLQETFRVVIHANL